MLNISPAPVSSAGLTFGTITRVQSTTANTAASAVATSITLTFGASLTVGNLLVVGACCNSTTALRVLDPSASIAPDGAAHNSTGPIDSHLAFCPITTAGTTVTVSLSSGTAAVSCAVGIEYSGAKLRPDTPIASKVGGAATTQSTDSLTTIGANDLLIAVFTTRGTFAAEQTAWLTGLTNSFSSVAQTSTSQNVANADRAVAVAERFVNSATSYSVTGTQASAAWANLLVGFVSD